MDLVVQSALDEICCEAGNGLHLRSLWPKLGRSLAAQGLSLCPNVKRAVWENLVEVPGLKLEACEGLTSCNSTRDLVNCTVEECEEMNVKIVAPEAMRRSFLGILGMEAWESSLSDTQRLILERLAVARENGIAQSELSKDLGIAPNNLFYQLKRLEIQGLIVRPQIVIWTNSGNPVATNMLYLYRYGKHLGCQQRLEITKDDRLLMDGEVADRHAETGDESVKETAKEDVHVKDYLPKMKLICDELEKAEGKVCLTSEIKAVLDYRGKSGHRAWRRIFRKLKDAGVVEECITMKDKKEVNCLRLLRSFSPSHFEGKVHSRGHDGIDTEQSMNLLKRGQITEQVVELPVLRQVYDMIDAAGSKGLTNTEVCRRLGLGSKEYHKRYFEQLVSRFGLHLQLEIHNRCQVYRVWTTSNFSPESSNLAAIEGDTVMPEVSESNLPVRDLILHENLFQPGLAPDSPTSMEDARAINESKNAAVLSDTSNGTTADDAGTSILQLEYNQLSSANEDTPHSKSVTNNNLPETRSLAVVTPPRPQSSLRYSRPTMSAISSLREQRILKMLQEEKFLIKAELHRRLEDLEKEKNAMMDRKTSERILNKLQQEGHCKCITMSVPVVTNCGRSRTIMVVLHPSLYPSVYDSPELLTRIHDKMRSFEMQVRKQSNVRQKKGQSVPILDSVQRIPTSARLEAQSERAEVMRSNGFVLAKMVRTKLLHIFLWGLIHSSPGWDDALLSSNHSSDMKNPHSTCKLFELDLAIRSMPLELFLQVVGSAQKLEDMMEKCKSGLLLCDLPAEEYKILMDTRASGRLSWLIDILRRLKLIRLVSKGNAENGANSPHTTLTHALELKPYIEEPVTSSASSGIVFPDLRPQVRHDFVLSSRKAVDEYWNTLEYSYAAAKSRAALLAFPGSAVHEVFLSRSWASVRVMTADQRVELVKRVTKDSPKRKLSFSECEKIAKDLNLTMEQVLRVHYDKRHHKLTRFQGVLDSEDQKIQTGKDKHTVASRKRRRSSDRIPSMLVNASVAEGQSSQEAACPLLDSEYQHTEEQQSLPTTSGDCNEEYEDVHTFIHKRALSRLNTTRQKKFSWTEEADRQLVIEYARYRAALGAKFHRVDWASISNLPGPPDACKRRMALLNSHIPFRKAVMKLCNILAERYAEYIEKFQDSLLIRGDSGKMVQGSASGKDSLRSSNPMSGEWANFDESVIEVLDDVLRYKRTAKLDAVQNSVWDKENSEDDDIEDCGGSKPPGHRSTSRQLPRKYIKLFNKHTSVSSQMHESVAVANAAELFKLIFLSNKTAPKVPILLAETLRRYSEHDLFAAFNYLREKKIMIGGSSNSPFALSQHFLHSLSSSPFPADTGKRVAKFTSWLHEKEKALMEEGIDVPADLQCGEVFTLCALVSSGELSINPCLPNEGVGEAEDSRTSKRKSDNNEPESGEVSKRSKTVAGEGELISRREKGFPGLKLCIQLETVSKGLAMECAPFFGGKDQTGTLSGLDVDTGSSNSDIADCVREMVDSGRINHSALGPSESPWEAMTKYAGVVMSSCSHEEESSILHPNLFKTIHSAIQKSGDNGLSMKEIRKVLNIKDAKVLEVMVEVLGAFGRILKVNTYDSIHIVDSFYRSKYFLTSEHDLADTEVKGQKRKIDDAQMPLNEDNHTEFAATSENEVNRNADEVHRVTILNLPEDDADPPAGILTNDMSTGNQKSEADAPETELFSADTKICRPLLPWMNGDGTINENVYKGLIRCVLGILMQNPGILEDEITRRMNALNPQSCKQLLEIMILDNHIITRKMHQRTSTQPPSILGTLLGDKFRKSKIISRVHYFANPMSTSLL